MPNTYNYSQFDDDLLEALQSGYSDSDLNELFSDVNLSDWAGSNLAFDEAAGAEQLRIRNARIGGEQALRELKGERLFEQAGVPKSMMPKGRQSLQSVLGRLNSDNPNGVIAPFVQSGKTAKGAEFQRRFHTREVESPFVKGRMEVRPFVNPETKGPLVSTFANANEFPVPGLTVDSRWTNATPSWWRPGGVTLKPQVGDRATELVTRHAAWLSGDTALRQSNNLTPDDFINSRNLNEFKALKQQLLGVDFKSNGTPVDAEVVFRGEKPRVQLYSGIYDSTTPIKRAVFEDMANNNTSFFGSVDALKNGPVLGNALNGKALKGYDIIQPQYERDYLQENTSPRDSYRQDKITKPPKAVTRISGSGIADEIERRGPNLDPNKVEVVTNNYQSNADRVYYRPEPTNPNVQDISGKGAVPQILDDLDYQVQPGAVSKPTALERMQEIDKEVTRRTRKRPPAGTRVSPRPSSIPKGEVGAVNAGLLDGAGKGLINGRLGGLANVALNGASRETGKRIAEGDYKGAATEFGTNYAIGAAADLGVRKAGEAIIKRLPAALAKGAAGTAASGGWAAPMAALYTGYEVVDGFVEGTTGKGLSTRMEEASDDAVTSAYERKFDQPAPKGGFVPKDKPLVQEKPQRAPTSLENINSAVKAVSEIAPEVKAQPAQITQATPQIDKPDTGNFLSQWTNKVRSWFQ